MTDDARLDALNWLTAYSQELGLYDDPPYARSPEQRAPDAPDRSADEPSPEANCAEHQ